MFNEENNVRTLRPETSRFILLGDQGKRIPGMQLPMEVLRVTLAPLAEGRVPSKEFVDVLVAKTQDGMENEIITVMRSNCFETRQAATDYALAFFNNTVKTLAQAAQDFAALSVAPVPK